ncbi:MAG: polyprenyl synthetase family protein [Actinomycetota bacterium]
MSRREGIARPLDRHNKEVAQSIETELVAFLAHARDDMEALDPRAAGLVDEIARILGAGGKRIRPLLCYWGHRAFGGASTREIVRAAASLELLHTFAIIHDDVMDRAETRRGSPTTHRLAAEGRPGHESVHFGISVAVLTGDLAFALSDRLFLGSGFPPEAVERALPALHEMRLAAVAGQFLDLSESGSGEDAESAKRIARLKTASYSVRGPLLIGAALAGRSGPGLLALGAFGDCVGEAFQLHDDLLGMFGDPASTGKDRAGDVRTGRPTLLMAEALRGIDEAGREKILKAYGRPGAEAEEVLAVAEAVEETGAPERVRLRIERLHRQGVDALKNAGDLEPPAVEALSSLAGRILE